jgi:signal transduction histidine kinase/ligand-binding sensor domain-containing protein
MHTRARCSIACLLLTAICSPCIALDLARTIGQFDHRAWTARDGAPLDAWAIAQTTDGWLWFGSPDGLHRFDGIRFERVPLAGQRSRAIATLLATPSDELWIGFARGGASVLRDGKITHYDEAQGLFSGSVMDLEHGVDGEIWAVGASGVARFDGERWQMINEAWGVARGSGWNVKLDARGTLWLSVDTEVMFLPRGARKFQSTGIRSLGQVEFQQSPDGRLWYTDKSGTRLLPGQEDVRSDPSWRNGTTSYVTMFDQDGALWSLGSLGVTRQRFPMTQPEHVGRGHGADVFNETSGLSGLIIRTLMEDREGNIWVATAAGVDRFRHSNVVRLPIVERQRSPSAIVAEPEGRLWIAVRGTGGFGGYNDRLWTYESRLAPVVAPFGTVSTLYAHRSGSIWFGGPDGIWRSQEGRFLKVADPPSGARDEIFAVTADALGNIWAAFVDRGLQRYRSGIWERSGNLEQLPDQTAYALATDAKDRVWVAYRDRVAVVAGDGPRLFGPEEGVNVGRPAAVSARRHLLVGGEYGLQVLVEDRFVTLDTQEEGASERVTGILETARGDLWWVAARGLVHVAASDLQDALATRSYRVRCRFFDVDDGFPGTSRANRPTPVIAEAPDGRIWFEGSAGLAFIDPRAIRKNPIAPVPWIRSVMIDGKSFDTHERPIVLQDVRDIQIDYTGLSFSLPERIQFKYQLVGFDAQWHDAGTRRQALYSNLPPGEYAFKLSAANEAGVWSDKDAVLTVVVPPAFHETLWFRMSTGVFGLAVLWLIHQLVLRQQAARLRAEHRARAQERERIARDLHDTLLQALQGLILRLHSVAVRGVSVEAMRKDVAGLLDNAEALLEQGRDRVQQIASEHDTEDLGQALAQTAERFVDKAATQFELKVSGTAWQLRPDVHREALAIGREALVNAGKHARASRICVEIEYGVSHFTISVSDDGAGISDAVLKQGGKNGHFGLQTMQRRANEIRATLRISSAHGAGTHITLHVPKHVK